MNTAEAVFLPETSLKELLIETKRKSYSIGFLKDEVAAKGIVYFSPYKIMKLKEIQTDILLERGFGKQAKYTDLDYADAGADIIDLSASVISQVQLLVKLEPFTMENASFFKQNQIIISTLDTNQLLADYFYLLKQKHITAFAIDQIEGVDGEPLLSNIFFREKTVEGISKSLENLFYLIIKAIAMSKNLHHTILTQPLLSQSLYCYQGEITNKEIAQKLHLNDQDFLSSFWQLN